MKKAGIDKYGKFASILLFLLLLTIAMSGCLENDDEPQTVTHTGIGVYFKANTTISYVNNLSEKYNISLSMTSGHNESGVRYITYCEYSVPEDRAEEVMEALRQEEKVEYVGFADISG